MEWWQCRWWLHLYFVFLTSGTQWSSKGLALGLTHGMHSMTANYYHYWNSISVCWVSKHVHDWLIIQSILLASKQWTWGQQVAVLLSCQASHLEAAEPWRNRQPSSVHMSAPPGDTGTGGHLIPCWSFSPSSVLAQGEADSQTICVWRRESVDELLVVGGCVSVRTAYSVTSSSLEEGLEAWRWQV